jgi:hypothetical protein
MQETDELYKCCWKGKGCWVGYVNIIDDPTTAFI